MRIVRADHPEVTIILPNEKIQVRSGDDVRSLIAPYVAVIRQALDSKRVGEWKGYTAECRIRQVRRLLTHYFYFHEGAISEQAFDLLVEDLLFVHKAGRRVRVFIPPETGDFGKKRVSFCVFSRNFLSL